MRMHISVVGSIWRSHCRIQKVTIACGIRFRTLVLDAIRWSQILGLYNVHKRNVDNQNKTLV
jgi:hypothetical protein